MSATQSGRSWSRSCRRLKRLGRPRADLRQVFNAIRYVTRSGAQWRIILRDLVPWGTAWSYFGRWREDGTWQPLHDAVRTDVRCAAGRDPHRTVDPGGWTSESAFWPVCPCLAAWRQTWCWPLHNSLA
jgi:transposase